MFRLISAYDFIDKNSENKLLRKITTIMVNRNHVLTARPIGNKAEGSDVQMFLVELNVDKTGDKLETIITDETGVNLLYEDKVNDVPSLITY